MTDWDGVYGLPDRYVQAVAAMEAAKIEMALLNRYADELGYQREVSSSRLKLALIEVLRAHIALGSLCDVTDDKVINLRLP